MPTTRQRLVASVIATLAFSAFLVVTHHRSSSQRTNLVATLDIPRTFSNTRASRSYLRLPDGGQEVPTTSPPPPVTTTTAAHVTTHRPVTTSPRPRTTVSNQAARAPPPESTSGLPAGLICIGDHEQGKAGYATNTGNGFTGRYQYTHSTWNNYDGYSDAYLAPPNIQDERALADYNLGPAHRHREWPNSSRICGV